MPQVNSQILQWARESAGLSLEQAASQLGLSEKTGIERLTKIEAGTSEPSRPLLLKMEKKYHRPLLTFYLSEPPILADHGQDFRTLHDEPSAEHEASLHALLRDVVARQGLLRDAVEDEEEARELEFIGSIKLQDGVETAVAAIQDLLEFDRDEFRTQRNVRDAFAALRNATEKIGVVVLLLGNLGSHHTAISPSFFRGISLADAFVPFIVINENDSKSAWSFTLLHELVHILLGQSGISGYDGEADIERFCDAVAAQFLLHPSELKELSVDEVDGPAGLTEAISQFAGTRKISRKMVAYNLLRNGTIRSDQYSEIVTILNSQREEFEANKARNSGGPNYYVVRGHRLGQSLIGLVDRFVAGGLLTMPKAGKVLGVKPTNVSRLIEENRTA